MCLRSLQAYKNEVVFGLSTDKDVELTAQFEVTKIPALIVIPPPPPTGSTPPKIYRFTGAMNHRSLHGFLKELVAAVGSGKLPGSAVVIPGASLSGGSVTELNSESLAKLLAKDKGFGVVVVSDGPVSTRLKTAIEDLSAKYRKNKLSFYTTGSDSKFVRAFDLSIATAASEAAAAASGGSGSDSDSGSNAGIGTASSANHKPIRDSTRSTGYGERPPVAVIAFRPSKKKFASQIFGTVLCTASVHFDRCD